MRRIVLFLAVLALAVLAVSPAEGGSTHANGCGAESFEYAGLQASNKSHGVSATIGTTIAPAVTDGHVGGWIGLGGTSGGPERQGRVDPDRPLRVPGRRHEPHVLRGHGRRPNPKYVELASHIAGRELAPVRRPRDGQPEVELARLGRRQRRSARRSTCRAATRAGTRRPSPRTGTAAQGPATPTPTASRTSTSRRARAARGAASAGSSEFQDPGYHVVPISNSPRSFLAASLAA